MPDITTEVTFIADLPLYQHEKPYYMFWPADYDIPEGAKSTNIKLDTRTGVAVTDIRDNEARYTLESHGFEILRHKSDLALPIGDLDALNKYKRETEQILKERFNAVAAYCYETRIRKNDRVDKLTLDFSDPLLIDQPAVGVHIDATVESGPNVIARHLSEELKELLAPGRRLRIVNTWRSMNPIVEDSPLAVTDYYSVDKSDLLAADRVTPFLAGEVYYLKHNSNLRWYWLSRMTSSEPFLMLTYDSSPGDGARFCAHAPINNPLKSATAPPRHSIETRNIIISDD